MSRATNENNNQRIRQTRKHPKALLSRSDYQGRNATLLTRSVMKAQTVTLLDELDSIPNWHRDLPLRPLSDQLWGYPTFYARDAKVSFSQWDKLAGKRNWELILHIVQYGVRTNFNSKPANAFTARCLNIWITLQVRTAATPDPRHNMMSCSSQDTEFDFRFYKEQKTACCSLTALVIYYLLDKGLWINKGGFGEKSWRSSSVLNIPVCLELWKIIKTDVTPCGLETENRTWKFQNKKKDF
jgi:hypothetical protein